MALAVSISVSMPLCAAKFSSKDLRPRKAPLAILPSLASVKSASNLLVHCYSTREILWTRNCHGHLAPLDHFGELVFCCNTSANSSTHKIIYGYWVGPDIDDGWGFVEAFINPTT
ncbi:uncharacterized protein [Euphorbia lathyris]|uniref:uncharacterized protein n=1 Tax=Euphorbia lathyris TaxID=212925 RepID=UPI0033133EA0